MTEPIESAATPVWARPLNELLEELGVEPDRGLTGAEAARRAARFGANELRQQAAQSLLGILAAQFRSLIVLLLVGASGLGFAFGETLEGAAIAVVVVLNVAIGFFTEWHAVRSMEALRALAQQDATVVRDGRPQRLPARALVPGDIVLLEAGDVVTADLRLLEASRVSAEEAALTGESVPVAKRVETVPADTELPERRDMLFKGTAVARGSALGLVVGTGASTELGRISSLVEQAEPEATPLERRLEALGRRLIGLTLAIAAGVGVLAIARGEELFLAVETAIALAVAAVPEGLPIVATLALARGVWRMARRNALVERLSAVETLGSTNVILTDKTGTLTEGRMAVGAVRLASGSVPIEPSASLAADALAKVDDPLFREAVRIGVLCNDGRIAPDGTRLGDPTETALLALGLRAGLAREDLLAEAPEVREEAFDPELKMMATVHHQGGVLRVTAKGAPEALLPACTRVRQSGGAAEPLDEAGRRHWLEQSAALAGAGMRVLALASGEVDDVSADPYRDLTLVGIVGLIDPPRPGVRDAITACQRAGVRVVMVTGDHEATARAIAGSVGIGDGADVVARATPEQKLELIRRHQRSGDVVAMTGDGVNDAPALKQADIGIAMGLRGTEVARQASALVLRDDEFQTIVAAIEQGRVIFSNIRKFVLYLLSCNVSEVLVVALAAVANAPLPLLPMQILFLNLVTDVFPALALGVGEGDPRVMERPPRPGNEQILARAHWWRVLGFGLGITACVLSAFALALRWLDLGTPRAVTVAFLTLAFAQLWHVVNVREAGVGLLRNEVTGNPWIWGALGLCSALLLAAVFEPNLARVVHTEPLPARAWGLVVAASLAPVAGGELWRRLMR